MVTALTWVMLHTLRPEAWALDERATLVQFGDYLQRVFLHGDFGLSWEPFGAGRPVGDFLRAQVGHDLWLLGGGLLLGLAGGIAGGALCAAQAGTLPARAIETLASVLLCTPPYVMGLSLLLLFGAGIETIDIGIGIPTNHVEMSESLSGWLGSMIAPWIVLALPWGAFVLRMMRGSMAEVLQEEYLRTARAKGLRERVVLRRHATPAALAPVFSLAGASIPLLVTNMVLVESVFSIPGVFQDLNEQVNDGNFPVIQGITVVAAALVAATALIADIALARLDPVVRQLRGGRSRPV